jgi:2,3-bisphosphoglycerate-dependent phosphoglycerate mutase
MDKIFNLYLVRHGESYNNAVPMAQRVCDPPLTELGQKQAAKLAERIHQEFDHPAGSTESSSLVLQKPTLDRVYTSAFLRTMQTIYPTTQLTGATPVIWTDLFEVGGCFDGHLPGQTTGRPGMTDTEIAEQFSTYHIPSDIDENGWYKSKPRETPELAETRAVKVVNQLFERYHGNQINVMCIIHGDLIRMLMRNLVPEQPDYGTEVTHNTSVTQLRFTAGAGDLPASNKAMQVTPQRATAEIVQFNDTSHLPGKMLSL